MIHKFPIETAVFRERPARSRPFDCRTERATNGSYYCTSCGFGRNKNITKPFRRNCTRAPNNIATRRQHLLVELDSALAEHHDNPDYRTIEEITTILEAHCDNCEHFAGNACQTYKGCDGRIAWMFTLRETKRHCKKGFWKDPREKQDG